MGYEFTVKVSPVDKKMISTVLKSLPDYDGVNHFEGRTLYEYRIPENESEMPNAFAEIETDGVYFCDNGHAAHVLELLKKALKEHQLQVISIIDHSD